MHGAPWWSMVWCRKAAGYVWRLGGQDSCRAAANLARMELSCPPAGGGSNGTLLPYPSCSPPSGGSRVLGVPTHVLVDSSMLNGRVALGAEPAPRTRRPFLQTPLSAECMVRAVEGLHPLLLPPPRRRRVLPSNRGEKMEGGVTAGARSVSREAGLCQDGGAQPRAPTARVGRAGR